MIKFEDVANEYAHLWGSATIQSEKVNQVATTSQKLQTLKQHYDQVSSATGVPWYVVGLIHSLEASLSLSGHLHNGDPLTAWTVNVPAGHPQQGNPPFTWVESAIDALTLRGLQNVGPGVWTVERIAYELERYNGFGYRDHHPEVKTPYLWSCTVQYSKGKYVADGKFDPNAVGGQVGAMALLKQLVAEGAVQVSQGSELA
jgi:lysozyme family protein